ncbi:MAG: SDR family oxidoreductase [Blastocatellia bacterium]|nr:SDR family oxidoreductase [Blastocatellia bacterium]
MHERKVALITGANKGLGFEIARQLGALGITVVLGARDDAKAEAAADKLRAEGINAHPVRLDVTNPADIAALPPFFQSRFGRLDILINNAGVMLEHGDVTVETFRQTYETNVFAPWFVTEALLPLLKAAPAGRIVNHSSVMGSIAIVGNAAAFPLDAIKPVYCSSKAALNMLTAIMARELEGTAVKVNAAHPGWVKTDMGTDEAPLEVDEGAATAVMLALLPEDGPNGGHFHQGKPLPW